MHMIWVGNVSVDISTVLLQRLYPGMKRTKQEDPKIEYYKSAYHMEIDASQYNFSLIHSLILQCISTKNIHTNSFTIVIIQNCEQIPKKHQSKLKIFFEKFSDSCRLLFIGKTKTNLSSCICSNCMNIKIPYFTREQKYNIIKHISDNEKQELPSGEQLQKILDCTNYSTLLCMLQLFHTSLELFCMHKDYTHTHIPELLSLLQKPKYDPQIYHLILNINIIPKQPTQILKDIFYALLDSDQFPNTAKETVKIELLFVFAKYEHISLHISNPLYCLQVCMRHIHNILHS